VNFKEIFIRAKENDTRAVDELIVMYKPLVVRMSIINGRFDEDLYQDLWLVFFKCVRYFNYWQ
jgi:hypothetical protein